MQLVTRHPTAHLNKRLPELNRSTLYIPVQPRNSTVQCIFIANFASRVVVSTMVRHLPAQFPDVVPRLFGLVGLAVHPANNRFSTPLFSAPSELLFPQLLCFHNYLRCPLVFSSASNFHILRRHRSRRHANVQNTGGGVGAQTSFRPSKAPSASRMALRGVPTVHAPTQRGRIPYIQLSLLQAQGSQVYG